MTETAIAALFDVDGTLVNSNYLHAVTWWQAFTQAGHDVPMAAIHHAIGMGSDQLLDALLPGSRDREADPGIHAAHGALYAAYWSRLRPLPRAPELLRACRESGLRVVLASSADPQEFAVLRAVLDAEDAIEEATSAGDVDAEQASARPGAGRARQGRRRAAAGGVRRRHGLGRAGVPAGRGAVHRPAQRRDQHGRAAGCGSRGGVRWAGGPARVNRGTTRRGSPSAARQLTTPPGRRGLFLRRQWFAQRVDQLLLIHSRTALDPNGTG